MARAKQRVVSAPADCHGGCPAHPSPSSAWVPADDFDAYLRLDYWKSVRYGPVVFVWRDVFKNTRTFCVNPDDQVELVKTANFISPGVVGGRWAYRKFRDLFTIRLVESFKE